MSLKKIFTILVVFIGLNTFASDNAILYGQIINVDDANKTITIQNAQNNFIVQVFPNTKLHGKNCGLFGTYSANERFSALKPEMFVEAKGYLKEEIFNAYIIRWQCGEKAH